MEILGLTEEPTFCSAKILCHSSKQWSQYPALVEGPPDSVVGGAMCEVQQIENAAGLAAYEKKAY